MSWPTTYSIERVAMEPQHVLFLLLCSYKMFQQYEMSRLHQVKCLPYMSDFNVVWLFMRESYKSQIPNLMAICPVGAESIHVDTDRWSS